MRATDSSFGLGFLLSFGALPLFACDDGSDDDGASSTPGTNTDDGTGTDPSAGTDPTQGTASDPSAGTDPSADDGDTGVDPSADDGDTGDELPAACQDIPITPGCQAQVDKLSECFPAYAEYYAEYAIGCSCNVTYYAEMNGGAACSQAFEDFYACIGTLGCEALDGGDPVCVTQSMAIDMACDAGDEASEDTTAG